MEYSLDQSDRVSSVGSCEDNKDDATFTVNEPTWFSHAFDGDARGGNDPVNSDPTDDDEEDSSIESMELASGSEFRLRPTTTAPGSNIGMHGNKTITTTCQASVSSITLGSKLAPSSKLVPGLLNNMQNTKDCEQSVNNHSTMSESSASCSSKDGQKGSIGKRMRGRSLGISFSRKNKDKDNKNCEVGDHTNSEKGNEKDRQLEEYLSSMKSKADKKKQDIEEKRYRGRSQSARDRSRQRDRSRSMVRQMKSFIHSIDGSSCCDEDITHTTSINNDSTDIGIRGSDRSYGKEESVYTGTTYRSSFADSNNDTHGSSPSTPIPSRNLKHDNNGSFWNKFKGTDQEQQISALHETNRKNECTIEQLREELTNLTNERNAFRTNSERLMEVMTRQKEEIQNEMHNERTGFANITSSQMREINQWKRKADNMYKKVKMLDAQARERERILQRYNEDLGKEGIREREERLRMLERDIDHILNNNPNIDASFKSNESVDASSLPSISDMESRFSSMTAKYEAQIKHLESQSKAYQDEVTSLKDKIEEVQDEKDDEVAMVKMLKNKLSGCKIIIDSMKEEDESTAASINDELVQKLGDLAEENGSLLSRCQQLERELEAAKSEEVVGRRLVKDSKASIEETTRKVDSVQLKNEEHLSTIISLRSENKALRGSCGRDLKHARQLINQLCKSLEGNSSPSSSDMAETAIPPLSCGEDDLLTIEEIAEENKALHECVADAIKKLAEQMKGKMTASAVRDDIAQEQQLSSGRWVREKMEMSTALDALQLENENLRASMKGMNILVQTAEDCAERLREENASLQKERLSIEQELITQNVTNQNLREVAFADRESAYETCKILQQEINMLRLKQSILESMERTEVSMPLTGEGEDDDSSNGNKEKALLKANDLLNKEVKQKNEALESVRTVLVNLKADQATVKKTIVALRQENARLKEGLREDPSPRPIPRPPSRGRSKSRGRCKTPPPPRKETSNGSSATNGLADSSKVTELESRVKRVENENKGLRDANSTLSTKLLGEMEKTDAMRVANDGLAARICKLVTFIQENAQGKQKRASNGSGSTPKKGSKNPVVTQSPHAIILKKSSSNPVATPLPIKKKTSRQST